MVGVFSWNDVDVLFTFNFDLDLFPRSQKTFIASFSIILWN